MKRTVITIAVTGVLLGALAGTAEARDGSSPLTTYGGCTDFMTTDYGDNGWECNGPEVKSTATVGDGTWVEARFPGWCTVPNPSGTGRKLHATPFHHVRCG